MLCSLCDGVWDVIGASGPVSGCWSSANRSILHIDRKSGEAHALGEGVVEGTISKFQQDIFSYNVSHLYLFPGQ